MKKLKVLELFAGTRSIGKAFKKHGHEVYSVEWDKQHDDIDLYIDIMELTSEMVIEKFGKPDIIWASPDCTTYSIAGIYHHRIKEDNGNLKPVSEKTKFADQLNVHLLKLINELNPKYYFIENPRGGMRKMDFVKTLPRYTVTYCQYGDFRMKPTDIFTNHHEPNFKPMCKNGDPCHVSAPRGSTTGTQGMSLIDKSRIPNELCEHITKISEQEQTKWL